jgi:hypothetical protein
MEGCSLSIEDDEEEDGSISPTRSMLAESVRSGDEPSGIRGLLSPQETSSYNAGGLLSAANRDSKPMSFNEMGKQGFMTSKDGMRNGQQTHHSRNRTATTYTSRE